MSLPEAFCWSKFGYEAGDDPASIVARKDRERALNGGIFLWGIGNSVWPSLKKLVEIVDSPRVVFTPMLSNAAKADVSPSSVALWREATTPDGTAYAIPDHSNVTSRFSSGHGARGRSHYALVCRSETSLSAKGERVNLDHSELRNLASGSTIGASQVTSVVKSCGDAWAENGRYNVAFMAELAHPYFVRLANPVPVPSHVRSGVSAAREQAFDELRTLRAGSRSESPFLTLW